jgi:uncharacterized membrane protein YgcG
VVALLSLCLRAYRKRNACLLLHEIKAAGVTPGSPALLLHCPVLVHLALLPRGRAPAPNTPSQLPLFTTRPLEAAICISRCCCLGAFGQPSRVTSWHKLFEGGSWHEPLRKAAAACVGRGCKLTAVYGSTVMLNSLSCESAVTPNCWQVGFDAAPAEGWEGGGGGGGGAGGGGGGGGGGGDPGGGGKKK